MSKFERIIIYGILVISLLFSTFALCRTYPRYISYEECNLGFDYLGAIIAIVSLAVAIFVAVQIYQSFNLKRDIDEQNRKLLNDAMDKFADKISALRKELGELKDEVEKKCEKSYVDEKIQQERNKEVLNDMYQMSLENMRNKDYPLAFIGFCNVAIMANKNKEENFLIRSIEWAISLIEQEENEIVSGINKCKFQRIREELGKIEANGIKDILDYICRWCISCGLYVRLGAISCKRQKGRRIIWEHW